MLEYVKMILQKVSFDLALFEKELRKSIKSYLRPNEVDKLKEWCYRMYNNSERHAEVIELVFS